MTLERRLTALAPALLLYWCGSAHAFRPFDGTDAAVAETGQVEIELGPAGFQRDGSARTLFVPATTFNYGVAPGWEAVIESDVAHGLSGGVHGASLVGNGASLKTVMRDGALQDKPGPSIATEFGVLLPGIGGDRGTGASTAGIVSQQWDWTTLHFNAAASVTREQHAGLFIGMIGEGPHDWPVRPVAELFYERDFGAVETKSVLIGAIWQLRDSVAFDVGLRDPLANNHTAGEIRAGVTFAFTVP